MTARRMSVGLFGLVGCAATAVACSSSPGVDCAGSGGSTDVSVTTVRADTGEPLCEGVTLTFRPADGKIDNLPVTGCVGRVFLREGMHTVTISAAGFESQTVSIQVSDDQCGSPIGPDLTIKLKPV